MISFEQINGVVVSSAIIACRKETTTALICLERKQHFGWCLDGESVPLLVTHDSG